MSHFLILSINYAPEPSGFAPHVKALGDHLATGGHAVTVCTGFPFAPRWRRWEAYRRVFMSRTVSTGDTVVLRVTHFIPRRPGSIAQRLAMESTFVVSAAWTLALEIVFRRRRPDAVVYVGAQPAIAMLARLVAWCIKAPYFVNINDIATQAAVDVGILRGAWLRRILDRFEFAAYAQAAGASVLCQGFSDWLARHGYPADRIRVIRSPIDTAAIHPQPPDLAFRRRHGIPGNAFVVLFSGSMGLKQGLSNVVAAADRLNAFGTPDRPIHWVLVGDGETRDDIVDLIRRRAVSATVTLLDFQPESEMSAMFSSADVLLLNQMGSVKDSVIPSKLLTYMAAGRPVLAAVNRSSQGADVVLEAGGGLVVAPEDAVALASGALDLSRLPAGDLARMGARNRSYAERYFDQRTVLAAQETFMLQQMSSAFVRPAPGSAS